MENINLAFNCSNKKLVILETDKIIYFEKKMKKIIVHLTTEQNVEYLNSELPR